MTRAQKHLDDPPFFAVVRSAARVNSGQAPSLTRPVTQMRTKGVSGTLLRRTPVVARMSDPVAI